MSARSLAVKTGRVLGTLLVQRVLGSRPITLVGYSLGSLVIFEALQHLASVVPSQIHVAELIQDVYLFGAPVSTDQAAWAAARRVVSGRLVNGYCTYDYILAILARVTNVTWGMAGLQPVEVQGVENIECTEVDGHLKWREMVGRCLQDCNAPGVVDSEIRLQSERRGKKLSKAIDMSQVDAEEITHAGPEADGNGHAKPKCTMKP